MNITIETLLKLTPEKVRERAKDGVMINVIRRRGVTTKDAPAVHSTGDRCRAFYSTTAIRNTYNEKQVKKRTGGKPYACVVKNFGTKKQPENWLFRKNSLVWVHCDCPYFFYTLEVVLARLGCSQVKHKMGQGGPKNPWVKKKSNGALPRIRNPNGTPYLCKHLYATVLFLLAQDRGKTRYTGPF